MLSNYPILWCPLLLLPSIFPSIRVFSNELALPIRWPNYCPRFISLQSKGLSRAFSSTTLQKHQFLGTQPSLCSNSYIHSWLWEKKIKKALIIWIFVGKGVSLLFNMLSTFVIAFLPRNKHLLIYRAKWSIAKKSYKESIAKESKLVIGEVE